MVPDELRTELEDERDFLLRSIEDLETEYAGGDLDASDYRALGDDYTARAAAVLRRLQGLDEPADSGGAAGGRSAIPVAQTPSVARSRSRRPMVIGVVATVALAAAAGYLVTKSSGERRPDQGVSGGPESSSRVLMQEAEDLDTAGKLVEAAKLYDAVLAKEPDNVVALSRRGWVLGRSGKQAGNVELLNSGLGYLDRAVKTDPAFADSHAYRGLVLGALARPAEAGCEFRLWLGIAPADDPLRPRIEAVLDEATIQVGGKLPDCPKPPVPVLVDPTPSTSAVPTKTP